MSRLVLYRMSRLPFLTHTQLHEVLFSFLTEVELFDYRYLHGSCADLVVQYAGAQLQDVMGQSPDSLPSLETLPVEMDVDEPDVFTHRTMHTSLVQLLAACKQDIKSLLTTCPGGARCLTGAVFQGRFRKALKVLCGYTDPGWTTQLVLIEEDRKADIDDSTIDSLLINASSLESLLLIGSAATNDTMNALAAGKCPKLKRLTVSEMEFVGPSFLPAIGKSCPELLSLNMSDTGGFVTDAICTLATDCNRLESLNLANCREVNDDCIIAFATHCRRLKRLSVAVASDISDASIKVVALNCPELQALDVTATNGNVTDRSIALIAKHCPRLRALSVNSTKGSVTDASIKEVILNCPDLVALNVGETQAAITDECIKLLAEKRPGLLALDVSSTGAVTGEAIRLVAQNCRGLIVLSTMGLRLTRGDVQFIRFHCPKLKESRFFFSHPDSVFFH